MKIAFTAPLLMLVAMPWSAALGADDTPRPAVDRSTCKPQPDCRVNFPDLPPGQSSAMSKGMSPPGVGTNAAAAQRR